MANKLEFNLYIYFSGLDGLKFGLCYNFLTFFFLIFFMQCFVFFVVLSLFFFFFFSFIRCEANFIERQKY